MRRNNLRIVSPLRRRRKARNRIKGRDRRKLNLKKLRLKKPELRRSHHRSLRHPLQKPPSQEPPKQPAPKSKKTSTKKLRKKPTETASTGSAEKKVVKNGGTVDPAVQLAPSVSDEQASQQRNSTSQLLATTDTNLKQLSARQLTVTQQDSVSQIRKYMEQAKTAEAAGDVQRAQNLASKALMLSDDLVKH